ncbi:hypothetical protein ZWY2020_001712 [Hordeum vulgare]|nr:hypothetical protein ZWY2020_001712 [Hordeum vulgare]
MDMVVVRQGRQSHGRRARRRRRIRPPHAHPGHPQKLARSAALEHLRAIRGVGARSAAVVQVRMEDPIYDAVAEENYAGAFIIDDDGLSYVDDSREEDWTHRTLPSSSDEGSGSEDGAPRKRTARWMVAVVAAS